MGEARKEALRVDLDSQVKLEFHGVAITSDAGLVAHRELDDALGLTATADDMFRDSRHGKNTQHELAGFPTRNSLRTRAMCVESFPGTAYAFCMGEAYPS